jgi:hypothetical protein
LLEEEIFVGCTQAMLQALEPELRVAFVLGGICEVSAPECAEILGITSAAFRKRLSRARATLDAFLARHCGVSDGRNRCRCAFQVNHGVRRRRVDPEHLRFAVSPGKTSLEVLQAFNEVGRVRTSIELFQTDTGLRPGADFAHHVRDLLASAGTLLATADTPTPMKH